MRLSSYWVLIPCHTPETSKKTALDCQLLKISMDICAASSATALLVSTVVMLQQPARQPSRLTSWRHSSWQGGHMMTSVLCTRCRSTESMWPTLLLSGEALPSTSVSCTITPIFYV